MQSKKEHLAEKEYEYNQLKKAEKLAANLENKIANIRAMGYKLIVLGPKVKITLSK